MWFGVLGPLEVRDAGGEPIAVGGSRARALLASLAADPGHAVPVERLIDAQYGDAPPQGAANALQAQVSRLRRVLPPDLITFDGTGYRLAADPSEVDAYEFERLAAHGRRLLAAGDATAAVEPLAAALELWRGPALADLTTDPGAGRDDAGGAGGTGGVAARLEELRLSAAEDLAEARLATGDDRAVADLRTIVAAHPLRERPVGLLMRGLHAAGRRAEALAVYAETQRVLGEELGTDPSPELAAVHLDILTDDAPAAAPERPGGDRHAGGRGTAPTPPPAPLTSFVGRTDELARLAALTAPGGPRLVTVLGPGGIGKTRLTVEAAVRAGRTGEVCFADLAPLPAETGTAETGSAVPRAVLGALGIRDGGYRQSPVPPADRLLSALAGRDLLLVLDNCEHVVDAAAALAHTLLAACPGLRVLATSREPLSITGEALLPLTPLDGAGDAPLDAPAVRLFADRAAAVRPGFAVDAANAATVADVCAALDGLPLAIELAAARLRTHTLDDLAERIATDDRFALLSRGDRTAAARHRTLRAVVEWSWAPLNAEERALARRFAVFTGGATEEAAAAVCGGDPADLADLLADLVDRSLVETDGRRYRMLSTIRLFCAEMLAESGEEERVRAAHAAYYLDLARRADPHLRRAEQLDWLAALSADHGNLLAALRWARDADPDTGLRLIAALATYLWLRGHRADVGPDAAALLGHARAALGTAARPETALAEEYLMCVVHAAPRAAPEHWARGRELVLTLDGPRRYPFAVALWGMAAGPPGGEARNVERIFGPDPWNRALILLSNALMAWFDGVPAQTTARFEDVLSAFRELGERWGMAQCLDWLAVLASWRGEWTRAEDSWAQAVRLLSELGAAEETVDVLVRRAESRTRAATAAGAPYTLDDAADDLRRATELTRAAGHPDVPASLDLAYGEVARFRGDLAEARRRYDAAAAGADPADWGAAALRADIDLARARLEEAAGDPHAARRHHTAALDGAGRTTSAAALTTAATAYASVRLADDDGAGAAYWLGAAVAVRGIAPAGDRDTARTVAAARRRAGDAAYAQAHARGAALSRAAVAEALAAVR